VEFGCTTMGEEIAAGSAEGVADSADLQGQGVQTACSYLPPHSRLVAQSYLCHSNFLGGDFGGWEWGVKFGLGYFQSISPRAAVQTSTSLSLRVDGEK
jgi:hypothetical protein